MVLDPIQANTRRSAGSFGWYGAFGTQFWVDRKEQLVGLLMIQGTSERDAPRLRNRSHAGHRGLALERFWGSKVLGSKFVAIAQPEARIFSTAAPQTGLPRSAWHEACSTAM